MRSKQCTRRCAQSLGMLSCFLQIGWFDRDENTSGALSAKLSTDSSYVRGAVGDTLGLLAQNASTLVTGYVIGFV